MTIIDIRSSRRRLETESFKFEKFGFDVDGTLVDTELARKITSVCAIGIITQQSSITELATDLVSLFEQSNGIQETSLQTFLLKHFSSCYEELPICKDLFSRTLGQGKNEVKKFFIEILKNSEDIDQFFKIRDSLMDILHKKAQPGHTKTTQLFTKLLNQSEKQFSLVTQSSKADIEKLISGNVFGEVASQKIKCSGETVSDYPVIITGDYIKKDNGQKIRLKPDPEPYLESMRLMNAQPKNYAGIEDTPIGMKSIQNTKKTLLTKPISIATLEPWHKIKRATGYSPNPDIFFDIDNPFTLQRYEVDFVIDHLEDFIELTKL